MKNNMPKTVGESHLCFIFSFFVLLCIATKVSAIEPIICSTNITASVLENGLYTEEQYEGFAEFTYDEEFSLTSEGFYEAIAACESGVPYEWTDTDPWAYGEIYYGTGCSIGPGGWYASRRDVQVDFDINLEGSGTSGFCGARLNFKVRNDDGTLLEVSNPLKAGTVHHFTSGLLRLSQPTEFDYWANNSGYIPEPIVLAELQQQEVHPNDPKNADIGEPVNAVSGAVTINENDLALPSPGMPLQFSRSYSSQSDYQGVLGNKWRHNYEMSVSSTNTTFPCSYFSNNTCYINIVSNHWMIMHDGDGQSYWFRNAGSNVFENPFGLNQQFHIVSNNYQVTRAGGETFNFNTNGFCTSISDAWQNALSLTYTNIAGHSLLRRVQHSNGQYLDFQYQSILLTKVVGPSTNLFLNLYYNEGQELTNAVLSSASGPYSTSYAYASSTNGSAHCLTQRVDAAGQVLTWNYATNAETGGLTSRSIETHASSNLAKVNFAYSTNENFTSVTYERDGTNQTYEYWFHPVMKVLEEIRGPNTVATNLMETGKGTRTVHDYYGNCTNTTVYDNGLGEWAQLSQQYDDCHRLTNMAFGYIVDPVNAWSFIWNTNWNMLASVTDAEGHSVEWDYTNGYVSASRVFPQPGQPAETRYTYASNGVLVSVTNANGSWVGILSDAQGNPTQTVTAAGMTNWMTWDAAGHATSISRPGRISDTNNPPNKIPVTTTFDVNELGWTRKITYPDASFETFGFNAVGKLTNHVDSAGRTNIFTWLPAGKMASSSRFLSVGGSNQEAKISVDYNQQLRAVRIKDELERLVESYQLDLQDRPLSATNVEGQVMSLTWGLGSMVKSMTRFDGKTNTLSYDSAGRICQMSFPDDTLSMTYFNNGLPMTAGNWLGVITNDYDGANRLIAQAQPVPAGNLTYAYYPAGQLSNTVSVAGTNTYILDAGDRLQKLVATSPRGQDDVAYAYDSLSGALSGASYSNGLHCSYTHDVMDRLTGMSWTDVSNRVLKSRVYTYTPAGLISNITFETGERAAYSYDSLDRLTREKHTDYYGQIMLDEKYEYDLAGNRTKKIVLDSNGDTLVAVNYSLAAGNKLGAWTVAETNLFARFAVIGHSSDPIGTNDRFGQLWVSNSAGVVVKPYVEGTNFFVFDMTVGMGTQTLVAAIRDAAGNMGYATNTFVPTVVTNGAYQYNAAGCLTNRQYSGKDYTDQLGLIWNGQYQLTAACTNGMLAESYGYDGVGRRIFIAEGGTTNWMVYDGNQVVAEVDGSGNLKKSYVYEGLDRVVSMTTYGTTTNTYYFIRDHLGSTLALADGGGNIVENYRYDAWGRVLGVYNAAGNQLDESAVGNRILWQGREFSFKTGLYHFRARWYDPITGRWLSNDPIGISGGLNQYVFCGNSPVNFRDPFGLCRDEPNIFGIGSLPPGIFPYVQPSSPWLNVPSSVANTVPFAANAVVCAFAGAVNSFSIDPNSPDAPVQAALALTGFGTGISSAMGPSGPIFGRFGAGVLNNNPVLRVGWGWKGSASAGQQVFRVAWGSKGSWVHGHMDIWPLF